MYYLHLVMTIQTKLKKLSTDIGRSCWGWKILIITCLCLFCVYQVQDFGSSYSSAIPESNVSVETKDVFNAHQRTWITMALCWSSNAQVHGKENFPYKGAAPFSTQLWMKFTPAKVIMQIVYSEPDISEELKEYKRELESYGAIVYLVPTGTELKVVLMNQ